jgi:serine/threonine protein kinase
MTLAARTRLGNYEILGPLGAGGMGEVYRARDLRLGREVAIKVLPADVASDADRLARFEREARTVAGLNHPNIVTLHTVEDADGVRFLTMELVEGQTLSTLLTPGGLPLSRILEIAVPLTDALVVAHERGVVHRDLKPGNVMVTRDGRVKVLDFGLAKMLGTGPSGQEPTMAGTLLSGPDQVAGTVPYMAPEQLRGETVDARADLFALGVILYELATGRRPFAGASSVETASAILRDTPESPSRARADLPADLERIIDGCLEKSPRERSQTALEVNNALRRLRKSLEREAPEKQAAEKLASIAVLPFANRSASADDEYFSDGLADELLGVLSQIKGLRVTARTSSFHFKGKDATIAEIGKLLGVATILEGSVRKSGNRVRISVQLVNVADSSHLWSETYDRTLEDIFAVQDDIAHSVVKELRTALLGEAPGSDASGQAKADVAQAAKGRTTDPEAQRLYLFAKHLLDRGASSAIGSAIEPLQQALALDPRFALAWVELGRAYARQAMQADKSQDVVKRLSLEAIDRALALEPELSIAHSAKAFNLVLFEWDRRAAEESMARALELSPGSPETLRRASMHAQRMGRTEEAIEFGRKGVEQDPLSPDAHFALATALSMADRFAEAEEEFQNLVVLSTLRGTAHAIHALNLLGLGRAEDAMAEAMRETGEDFRLWALAIIHQRSGRPLDADEALGEIIERFADESAYQIAEIHAVRGESDQAFEWLHRAYEQRDAGLWISRQSPYLRSLHGDPRWGEFMKKMGFEK